MNRVIITAGGIGKRMGNEKIPKQFMKVNNIPIIIHTILHFEKCYDIDSIVIVCIESFVDELKKMLLEYDIHKVVSVVSGGQSGQESIFIGLKELTKLYGLCDDIVLIHDSVRPLINNEIIIRNIKSTKKYGSCITVNLMNETLCKMCENIIETTVNRDDYVIGRAPQTFFLSDIYNNHLKANEENKKFIDSASLMNYYGFKLHTELGPIENIKITTPVDISFFKFYLQERKK